MDRAWPILTAPESTLGHNAQKRLITSNQPDSGDNGRLLFLCWTGSWLSQTVL